MRPRYTREQRAKAKAEGLKLCTISTPAVTLNGPMTKEEAAEIEQFIHQFIRRRSERRKEGQGAKPK